MVYNEDTKHLHFEMPKTASGSIHKFCGYGGYKCLTMHSVLVHLKNRRPEVYLQVMKGDWLVSCIVRNPWEHAVSFYYHALDKKRFFKENFFGFTQKVFREKKSEMLDQDISLKRFLQNGYLNYRSQSKCLKRFDPDNNLINMFVNFNNKEELETFISRFGIDEETKRIHEKREIETVIDMPYHDDYRKYYDDETYAIIEESSRDIIDLFDYKF